MSHTTWKGMITFGMVSMSIKLTTAARPETVDLNMLNMVDGEPHPVGMKFYDKVTGQELSKGQTEKGYKVGEGQYVVLTKDDLSGITPKSNKMISVSHFVAAEEIDPAYFETSYFVEPDTAGIRPFALLVAAMKQGNAKAGKNMVALGKWTHVNREHVVALRIFGRGCMMMHTLYHADEIADAPAPVDLPVNEMELKMATLLLSEMTGPFEPSQFQDTYRSNLLNLINSRIAARDIKGTNMLPATASPSQTLSPSIDPLMASLRASLAVFQKPAPEPEPAKKAKARKAGK